MWSLAKLFSNQFETRVRNVIEDTPMFKGYKMAVFFSKLTAEGVNFVSAWVAKEFNFNSALAILAFLSSHDALFSFNYYWSSPIAVAGYSDQWWSVHPVKKGDTVSEWAISRVVRKYITEFS